MRLPMRAVATILVFTAVQGQLGLSLQREEMPTVVLVIDRIERPTEN